MAGGMSFAKRRKALQRACTALDGLDAELWQAHGADLGPLMSFIDRLGEQVDGAKVAVLREAIDRGETGKGSAGTHAWLLQWAPSYRSGGSSQLIRVVDATRDERYAQLREALATARVPVGNAACVVEEFERIRHRLHAEAQAPVMDCLVSLAESGGRRDIRAVRQRLVARYGNDGELQAEEDRLRSRRSMSQPLADGGGLFDYHLVVDAEAKAVIEAAVGALSAPRPVDGEPDHRPSGQRRLEALLDVVRRGVASADGVATTTKAQLFVTMPLADLVARANAGTVLASTDAGFLLGPETVRRLACDAGVIPVVLGSDGEVLDLGRRVRLFTEGQAKALWLRDGGCTFPGCTAPAAWSDAHHLWHWADGGPSDVDNAALLCGRHHTVVHTKGYFASVVEGQVDWDLTPGAYDQWLAARRAAAGDRAAGGLNAGRGLTDGHHDDGHHDDGHHDDGHHDDGPRQECAPAREFDLWGEAATAGSEPAPPPWRP
jgi:uncharacterized protein DUF222